MAKPSTIAQDKYNRKTYTQLNLRLKKQDAEDLRKFLLQRGESINGYITRLIKEDMWFENRTEEEMNEDFKDI